MFKVLIIDDEPAVRRGIANVIDWTDCGCCICGMAEDGVDGLEKIRALKPDLILLDIKMPRMDGLELIQKLNEERIDVKTVILSGYAQFEYAQKAMKYGVDAYLLKPVDENELILLVREIQREYSESCDLKKKDEKRLMLSTEKAVENIVFGCLSADEVLKLDLHPLAFPWETYQVLLVDTNEEKPAKDKKDKINQILLGFTRDNGKGHIFSTDNLMGVLFSRDIMEMDENVLIKLWRDIRGIFQKNPAIAVGRAVNDIEGVHRSYQDALDLFNRRFVFGSHKILTLDLIERNKYRNEKLNIHEIMENLIPAMNNKNQERVLEVLGDAMQSIKRLCPGQDTVRSYYFYIYNMIVGHFQDKNIALYEMLKNDRDVINEINAKGSLDELNEYMSNKLIRIVSEISTKKPVDVIGLLIDYINKNYDKDLKLYDLAGKFNYGSTYLGKLIKNHAGCSFNDYLDRIRIDKSKQMLKEGYKVYEIANSIGYCNIDYFYIKFKKIVGMSPTQYRKGLKGNGKLPA